VLPSIPPKRLRWLIEPLFQPGVDKGLPQLMLDLEAAMGDAKLGQPRSGELPACARALAEVATSVGAVALADAARALESDVEAELHGTEAVRRELSRAVLALKAHGILSRKTPPVFDARGLRLF
jgi:hypothetical protein